MNKTLIKMAQFSLFAQQQEDDNFKLFIPVGEASTGVPVTLYVCSCGHSLR